MEPDKPAYPATSFMGVHLTVKDMSKAIAFYRRVGLDVPEPVGGGSHVEIEFGRGMHLALSTVELTSSYDPGWRESSRRPGNALQFQLASRVAVDALYGELIEAGAPGHLEPFDAFWGNRYAEVEDPDGNLVGFHSMPNRPGPGAES
jgi:uncharacterized glyoxalase superfamily protein PhnB